MSSNDELYHETLKLIRSNEMLYYNWESQIAAHMSKKWPSAFSTAAEVSGSENPTVMEVADMGTDEISDKDSFLSDLYEIFRTLAKGCKLDDDGNWS